MSNLTSTTQAEQLHTQNNTEETHNSKSSTELLYRQQVKDTPFWVIGDKDKGKYYLTMGKWRLTETLDSPIEAEKYVYENNWQLILKMIGIVTEQLIDDYQKTEITRYQEMRKHFGDLL